MDWAGARVSVPMRAPTCVRSHEHAACVPLQVEVMEVDTAQDASLVSTKLAALSRQLQQSLVARGFSDARQGSVAGGGVLSRGTALEWEARFHRGMATGGRLQGVLANPLVVSNEIKQVRAQVVVIQLPGAQQHRGSTAREGWCVSEQGGCFYGALVGSLPSGRQCMSN